MRVDIQSTEDISHLIRTGFSDWEKCGRVRVRQQGKLLQFNYKPQVQYEGDWNFFEIVSRGLIMHAETGEVIARPFDKFFNWDEGGRRSNGRIVNITDKMDGSLGICYNHNGLWYVATRGSFDSEQAQWATRFLDKNLFMDRIKPNRTLLFEIVYNANRIIVDYDFEGLVLIGCRSRDTGEYADRNHLEVISSEVGCMIVPRSSSAWNVETLSEACEETRQIEGWVVEFDDGQRFKFKTRDYRIAHRLMANNEPKRIAEHLLAGTLDNVLFNLPDYLQEEIIKKKEKILSRFSEIHAQGAAFVLEYGHLSRKEIALKIQQEEPRLLALVMAIYSGKPMAEISKVIFKKLLDLNALFPESSKGISCPKLPENKSIELPDYVERM